MVFYSSLLKMKHLSLFIFLVLLCYGSPHAQKNAESAKEYSFIIVDSPASLFTMRQFNENYLSSYRLLSSSLDKHINNVYLAELIKIAGAGILFLPLTHEEGHRSILTANNIGSISRPYFDNEGLAKVAGVTDATLMKLRDNDLPTFIRLHTAGLESDYMLNKRAETLLAFNEEGFDIIKWEYWFRKMGIMQYYLIGLFKYDGGFKEDENELDRDIVGIDTYGAARHFFRPEMDFFRYTNYSDLEHEERKFVRRMGYRSLLNLLHPAILGIPYYQLNHDISFQIGLGYSLAPFGDFIDQNLWIKSDQLKIHAYFRQYQNHKNWFPAAGIGLHNTRITDRLSGSLATHYWAQPENLDFFSTNTFNGGAIDAVLRYRILNMSDSKISAISIDLGMVYKTEGFLPENLYLKEHFGISLGASVIL
jgi:hypothetical protein